MCTYIQQYNIFILGVSKIFFDRKNVLQSYPQEQARYKANLPLSLCVLNEGS